MDLQRLVITRPSGNVTAIVFDDIPAEQRRDVGTAVQNEYPSVEQVLFVTKRKGQVHGQMAGGEFCGNAARSLGYLLAEGKASTQTFTMSGLSTPVVVEVKPHHAQLSMQTTVTRDQAHLGNCPISIVHLEGISYAVLDSACPTFYNLKEFAARPDRWHTIKPILDDLGLSQHAACGIIFAERKGNHLKITPYVLVRDIETFVPETACASGSLATAIVHGKSVSIQQPSGDILHVDFEFSGNTDKVKTVNAHISGNMSVLWDGPAKDLDVTPKPNRNATPPKNAHFFPAVQFG